MSSNVVPDVEPAWSWTDIADTHLIYYPWKDEGASTTTFDATRDLPSEDIPRIASISVYSKPGSSFCSGLKVEYKNVAEPFLLMTADESELNLLDTLVVSNNDYIMDIEASIDELASMSPMIAVQFKTAQSKSVTCGNIGDSQRQSLGTTQMDAALLMASTFDDVTSYLVSMSVVTTDLLDLSSTADFADFLAA